MSGTQHVSHEAIGWVRHCCVPWELSCTMVVLPSLTRKCKIVKKISLNVQNCQKSENLTSSRSKCPPSLFWFFQTEFESLPVIGWGNPYWFARCALIGCFLYTKVEIAILTLVLSPKATLSCSYFIFALCLNNPVASLPHGAWVLLTHPNLSQPEALGQESLDRLTLVWFISFWRHNAKGNAWIFTTNTSRHVIPDAKKTMFFALALCAFCWCLLIDLDKKGNCKWSWEILQGPFTE